MSGISAHMWPWVKMQIVPRVNIPIPTKIGNLKWVAKNHLPAKMGSRLTVSTSRVTGCLLLSRFSGQRVPTPDPSPQAEVRVFPIGVLPMGRKEPSKAMVAGLKFLFSSRLSCFSCWALVWGKKTGDTRALQLHNFTRLYHFF